MTWKWKFIAFFYTNKGTPRFSYLPIFCSLFGIVCHAFVLYHQDDNPETGQDEFGGILQKKKKKKLELSGQEAAARDVQDPQVEQSSQKAKKNSKKPEPVGKVQHILLALRCVLLGPCNANTAFYFWLILEVDILCG